MRSQIRKLPSCWNLRIISFFLYVFLYILCLHFCLFHTNIHIYFSYTLLNEGSYVPLWGDFTSFDWSGNPVSYSAFPHYRKTDNLFFLVCSGKSRCLMKFPYGGRSCLRATYEMPKIFVLSCFANQTFILLEQSIFSQITKWY